MVVNMVTDGKRHRHQGAAATWEHLENTEDSCVLLEWTRAIQDAIEQFIQTSSDWDFLRSAGHQRADGVSLALAFR